MNFMKSSLHPTSQVASVNTLINRGKIKRVRLAYGKKPNWKKAYITLKAGQKIAEFEGV